MSSHTFGAAHTLSSDFGVAPHAVEQHAAAGELSMEELDDVNGGLVIAMLFMIGFTGRLMYAVRYGY